MKCRENLVNPKLSSCLPWFCLEQKQTGFTLLELMVVILFISILSLVALPNFIRQVGKARETDASIKLGAIARSQQSYHYQKGEFAPSMADLNFSGGPMSSPYYSFPDPVTDTSKAKHLALPLNADQDQVRNYAIGVYFDHGAYGRSTCRGYDIGADVDVGDTPSDPCTNSGIKIE